MLPTIGLLGKPSRQALYDIIRYHNKNFFESDTLTDQSVTLSDLVSLSGRRTRINVSARSSTPYQEASLINQFNFVYNRLNLTDVFQQYTFAGIDIELPATTEKVIAKLKEQLHFVHDPSEFIQKTVYESGDFVLEAAPDSLRWQGSITISLTVQSDITSLIWNNLLNGLEHVLISTPIGAFITRTILFGLRYKTMHPLLSNVLSHKVLRGLYNQNLTTPIDKIMEGQHLAGHWVDDNGTKLIVSDTSLPPMDALAALVNDHVLADATRYRLKDVKAVTPEYPQRGSVTIKANAGMGFTGTRVLYFEKLALSEITEDPSILVSSLDDLPVALSEVNTALNTQIDFENVSFSQLNYNTWSLNLSPDDAMFYGSLDLVDLSAGPQVNVYAENFVPIEDTEFVKYVVTENYAFGPSSLGTSGNPIESTDWIIRVIDNTQLELCKSDNSEPVVVYTHPTPVDHVSLSFDQNGAWLTAFMSQGEGFLRWFDPVEGTYATMPLGEIRTPFVMMDNPHRLLGDQELVLVYVQDNNLYYRRQLNRFQTPISLSVSGVAEIIQAGHTVQSASVVVYITTDGEIRSIHGTEYGTVVHDIPPAFTSNGGIDFIELREIDIDREFSDPLPIVPEGSISFIDLDDIIVYTPEITDDLINPTTTGEIVGIELGDSLVTLTVDDTENIEHHMPVVTVSEFGGDIWESLINPGIDDTENIEHLTPDLTILSFNAITSPNRTDLYLALQTIETLNESYYTPVSWSDLMVAKDAAEIIFSMNAATQQMIDDEVVSIYGAIDALEPLLSCVYPLYGNMAAAVSSDPLLISGADNQSFSYDSSEGLSSEQHASTAESASPENLFALPEDNQIVWYEGQDLVFRVSPVIENEGATPFFDFADLASGKVFGAALTRERASTEDDWVYGVRITWTDGVTIETSLQASENTDCISVGVTGLGEVYVNVDGIVEKIDTSSLVSDGFAVWVTAYGANNDVVSASGRIVTDASDFINTYPEIVGIELQTDLCDTVVRNDTLENIDPFADDVVLLMRFDGQDQSTTFLDEGGNYFAPIGDAVLSESLALSGRSSLQLYQAGSGALCSTSRLPELPAEIGDPFTGGFYIGNVTVDDTEHGVVMAHFDDGLQAQWKTSRSLTANTDSYSDGLANTLAMVADDIDIHPLGKHCYNFTGGGYNDWYMPAPDEIYLVHETDGLISILGAGSWGVMSSSREANQTQATTVSLSWGSYSATFKDSNQLTMPVRRINISPVMTIEFDISIHDTSPETAVLFASGNTWEAGASAIRLSTGRKLALYVHGQVDPVIESNTALPENEKVDAAMDYDGENIYLYLNGQLDKTETFSGFINLSLNSYSSIGMIADEPSTSFIGVLGALRITRAARYQGVNYTPESFPSIHSFQQDPIQSYVISHIVPHGEHLSDDIIDDVDLTQWFSNGAAYIDATRQHAGLSTIRFGAPTDWIRRSLPETLNGDFTIEAWVYCTDRSVFNGIMLNGDINSNANRVQLGINPGGQLDFYMEDGSETGVHCTSTDLVSEIGWVHVAVSRHGNVNRCFVNGVVGATTSFSSAMTLSNDIYVGAARDGAVIESFNGNIAMLRITRGVAKYIGNFTPSLFETNGPYNVTVFEGEYVPAADDDFDITYD